MSSCKPGNYRRTMVECPDANLNGSRGLQLAGASTVLFIFAGSVTVLDLTLIACLSYIAPRGTDAVTQEEGIDNDAVPYDAVPFLAPEIEEKEM